MVYGQGLKGYRALRASDYDAYFTHAHAFEIALLGAIQWMLPAATSHAIFMMY